VHRTTLRCTRIHRFQTAAIFYQNFYPNRQLIGADMLYVLVTAASWHGLPRVSPAFQAGYAGSIPAVGQTSGPVEEVERVELSFVVGVGVDLERGG
jgi:hypothetical protein